MRSRRILIAGGAAVLALDALVIGRVLDARLSAGLAVLAVGLNLAVATGVLASFAAGEGSGARSGAQRALLVAAFLAMAGGIGATAFGTRLLWGVARYGTLPVVELMLKALGRPAAVEPERAIVRCGAFAVRIDAPCSGLEGVALLWCFLGVHLLAAHRRVDARRAALVVLPVATAVMWLANAARIAALVLIGAAGHAELAIGGFHSHAGWLLFDAVALAALVAVEVGFARAGSEPEVRAERGAASPPVEAWVLPQMVCLAVGLLAEALDPRPSAWYPMKMLLTGTVLALAWRPWRLAWRAPDAAALGWGVVAFALWVALEPAAPPGAAGPPARISARALGSVLVVPLAEELAFRGFLMRRLVRAEFAAVPYAACGPVAVLGSALAFGALHGRFLAAVLAGVIYALAARRRGELADAVAAHAVTNALIAVAVIAGGWTSLW